MEAKRAAKKEEMESTVSKNEAVADAMARKKEVRQRSRQKSHVAMKTTAALTCTRLDVVSAIDCCEMMF